MAAGRKEAWWEEGAWEAESVASGERRGEEQGWDVEECRRDRRLGGRCGHRDCGDEETAQRAIGRGGREMHLFRFFRWTMREGGQAGPQARKHVRTDSVKVIFLYQLSSIAGGAL